MVALTRRKEAWVSKWKPDMLRGDAIVPNIAIAQRYYARLAALIDLMAADTEKQLKASFDEPHAQEFFAQDASVADRLRIITDGLTEKYTDLFGVEAQPIAQQTATQWDAASAGSVQSSIQKLAGGLTIGRLEATGDIGEILTATIAENVGLIKSIASRYLADVQGAVMRSVTTGNGLQDLVPFLEQYKGYTLRKANLVALDQTRKAMNNLSRARLLKLNMKQGIWRHSGGSDHPRKTHIAMSGKTFDLAEGLYDSEVGRNVYVGELPYCGCFIVPVITF